MKSEALKEAARKQLPTAVALRRRIHASPEIGLHLPETRKAVLDEIADLDLEIELSERTSGIIATLRGSRPGRTILLRADMDALPMPEDTDWTSRRPIRPACMHAGTTPIPRCWWGRRSCSATNESDCTGT
jgi:metal-dependent amidase/aminoacylase/carboxypeptidase family protein